MKPIFKSLPRRIAKHSMLAVATGLFLSVGLLAGTEPQPGSQLPERSELTLEEALVRALQYHYAVRVGELAVEQASAGIKVASEPFDPVLSASIQRFDDGSTGPSDFPYSIRGQQETLAVSGRFSTGTDVSVSLNHNQYENLDQSDYAQASVTVTQNLLQGRGTAVNRAPIRIASRRLEISKEALRQQVIDTVTEVHLAYYDALLANENLQVAKESLELSRQLLWENQQRARIGSIASSDILQAEAEVAAREELLHQAIAVRVQARNRLKRMLSDRGIELLGWDFALEPLGAPVRRSVNLLADYQRALASRPDHRNAVLNLDIAGIESLRAGNQALPSLDLYAQMSLRGQAESVGRSLSEMLDDRDPRYAVGMRISRPLSNRAAEGRKAIASLDERRLRWSLRQLEQAILFDLEDSAVQIEQNWNRLQAARRGKDLAEQSLTAEQKRFQTGASSTFVLIRLQSDLAAARIRELLATNDYRKSLITHDRQTADLLAHLGIEV
jgi:outer membrane protein